MNVASKEEKNSNACWCMFEVASCKLVVKTMHNSRSKSEDVGWLCDLFLYPCRAGIYMCEVMSSRNCCEEKETSLVRGGFSLEA